jgi:PPOX class probable FMN-dependent enzyme
MGKGRSILRRIHGLAINPMHTNEFGDRHIATVEVLRRLYGAPGEAAVRKEIDHVNAHYRALIEASPFLVLATCGSGGLDCSPRGDAPGFVCVHNPKTLLIPDRRGNNRIDTLCNLAQDPRIALLFLIPGCGETLRVTGRAEICIDPAMAQRFVVYGKAPRSVIVVRVERVYFQCARAILRSKLWDPGQHVDRKTLPSAGAILAELSGDRLGGSNTTAPCRSG